MPLLTLLLTILAAGDNGELAERVSTLSVFLSLPRLPGPGPGGGKRGRVQAFRDGGGGRRGEWSGGLLASATSLQRSGDRGHSAITVLFATGLVSPKHSFLGFSAFFRLSEFFGLTRNGGGVKNLGKLVTRREKTYRRSKIARSCAWGSLPRHKIVAALALRSLGATGGDPSISAFFIPFPRFWT